MREIEIKQNEAGQRFDKYLKKLLCNASSSFIYKMLRKKNIVLNGKKADGSEKLKSGDAVKLFLSEETYLKFTVNSEEVQKEYEALRKLPVKDLQVVYEDDDILVINKPAGLLSQKAAPEDVSANEWILAYLIQNGTLSQEDFMTFRPSICNRLDRNTSGLLIAGKSLKGLQKMAEVLQERTVKKYYRCIVAGEWTKDTYLKGYLTKDAATNRVTITEKRISEESKEIETEYHPITNWNGYTELEVHLITGRSHQIRAHLASDKCPIVGDTKYGDTSVNRMFRDQVKLRSQLLHAYRMEFADGKVLVADVPQKMEEVRTFLTEKKGFKKR